jgi:ornithine carbamoyltransferase
MHFFSIRETSGDLIRSLLTDATRLKAEQGKKIGPLAGQTWALLFSKPSTRTRVSFEVALRELGAGVMFLSHSDIQLGRGEPIIDTARVLGRMVHGAVIRTFAQKDVVDFAQFSGIPTINALTDEEHPCQIIADLQTILEKFGTLDRLKVCFVGDGNCNVVRSWIWAAERLGFELNIAAPKGHQPEKALLDQLKNTKIQVSEDLKASAAGATVLYTDVWVSMGQESEAAQRLKDFKGYQINKELLGIAEKNAIVLHCLPAYRGKEITEETLEQHAQTIFDQAENRLHAQKAILRMITKGDPKV